MSANLSVKEIYHWCSHNDWQGGARISHRQKKNKKKKKKKRIMIDVYRGIKKSKMRRVMERYRTQK